MSPQESSKLSALNSGKEAKGFDTSTVLHYYDVTASKGQYTYARVPDHPNATSTGYVLEHRVVVENWVGRYLTDDEVVHHINDNKKDNRLENLRLMSRKDHGHLHKKPRVYLEFVCPNCGCLFIMRSKGPKTQPKEPKCSRKCNGEYSRKIQLGRII